MTDGDSGVGRFNEPMSRCRNGEPNRRTGPLPERWEVVGEGDHDGQDDEGREDFQHHLLLSEVAELVENRVLFPTGLAGVETGEGFVVYPDTAEVFRGGEPGVAPAVKPELGP